MPNTRAKNKVFGGFIDRRFKAVVKRAAANAGMKHNVFGFAMEQVFKQPRSKRRSL